MANNTIGFVCQLSTASPSGGVPVWVDITNYVMKFSTRRSKQRQLQRFEAGTLDITLKNTSRIFDPTFTLSSFYPNLAPMNQIRVGFINQGQTYWVFTGYVERWPQSYQGATWAQVDITAVDTFELLANHALASAYASFTTTFGSNNDVIFTSITLGYLGNSTTVTYVAAGLNTALSISVSGTDITVNLATNGAGTVTSTAAAVVTAVKASTPASALVTVALPAGSDGTGVITGGFSKTALSGGTFVQEMTGAFISDILNYIAWNGGTNISSGVSQVQAQAIPSDGTVKALDQIYLASDTEDGAFFIDKLGRPTFLDRVALSSSTYRDSVMTLTDHPNNTTTFGYQNITTDYDKDLIYNDVRVTRLNGTTQIVDDATSDNLYFTRTLTVDGILNTSDAEALSLAQALLARYKNPILRFEPVKVMPANNVAFWSQLLVLDLLETVTIKRTPPGGTQNISRDVALIGIDITCPGSVSETTWSLSVDPTGLLSFFLLNDPVFGLLDKNSVGY